MSVPLKSPQARNIMLTFLRENYHPWSIVAEAHAEIRCSPEYDRTQWIRPGEGLAYDDGTTKLGFNVSASSHYAISILRWASLRLGRQRPFKRTYGIMTPVPYIVYDGYEAWPTLDKAIWQNRCQDNAKWCLTNKHGFRPEHRWWHNHKRTSVKSALALIQQEKKIMQTKDQLTHNELKRLSKLWEEAQHE